MSKEERISFRLNNDEKKEIILYSQKKGISVSDYVYQAVTEKMKGIKLNDGQSELVNVIDIGVRKSLDSYFKQLMLVLNKMDFNIKWLLKQQDIFMYQVKIPQIKEDLVVPFMAHPVTEKAEEIVLKDIRKMAMNKKEFENEQE